MYSDNERISTRQLRRLLLCVTFGVPSLLLPAEFGAGGIGGLLVGTVLALLYTGVLRICLGQMENHYYAYLKKIWGRILAEFFYLCYGVIALLAGAYGAKLLASLVCQVLLQSREYVVVLTVILLLAAFGASAGVESQARIYELMFWVMFLPLGIMLLLSVRQVEVFQWFPLWEASRWKEDLAVHSVLCLAGYLPVTLLLFLKPYLKEKRQGGKAGTAAVGRCGLLLLLLYLILLGSFGGAGLSAEKYPVITLLGMIRLPGDFVKRLDTVMVGIWFFALYALVEMLLYTGTDILRSISALHMQGRKTHGRCFLPVGVAVLVFGYGIYRSTAMEEWLRLAFYEVAVPFLVLLPLFSSFLYARFYGTKRRQVRHAMLLLVLLTVPMLQGCSGTELENKNFPLAVTLELEDGQCRSAFLFPDLGKTGGQQGNAENELQGSAIAASYYEAQKRYEKNNRCQLDTGHTKALIISADFLKDADKWNDFLQTVRSEHTFARNTLVYVSSDVKQLEACNKTLPVPLGSYLEQTVQNEQDIKEQGTITLAKLLNEQKNRNRTLLIPMLDVEKKEPRINGYKILQDFKLLGEASNEEALYYYLLQNQLDKLSDRQQGAQAWLSGLHCDRSFHTEEDAIVQQLKITATLHWVSGRGSLQEMQRKLASEIEALCEQFQEQGIDLTDSYRQLAMYDQKLYERSTVSRSRYRGRLRYEIDLCLSRGNE